MSDFTKKKTYIDFIVPLFFSFTNESQLAEPSKRKLLQQHLKSSEINKGIQRFDSLRSDDEGRYLCMSLKYKLFKVIRLYVKNEQPIAVASLDARLRNVYHTNNVPDQPFCGLTMFKCSVQSVCIPRRYLCDGSPDCKDGSDESEETCNGDPCKGKKKNGNLLQRIFCCVFLK